MRLEPKRKRRVLTVVALLLAVLVAGLAASRTAWAQSLVADLSNHLIAINTGFVGTEVVLFGAIDGNALYEIERAAQELRDDVSERAYYARHNATAAE